MSVFIHVTVVPTAMLSSSGANALFPSVEAPTGIVTGDAVPPVGFGCGPGDGEGDGVGEGEDGYELLPLHPIAHTRIADNAMNRTDNIASLRS